MEVVPDVHCNAIRYRERCLFALRYLQRIWNCVVWKNTCRHYFLRPVPMLKRGTGLLHFAIKGMRSQGLFKNVRATDRRWRVGNFWKDELQFREGAFALIGRKNCSDARVSNMSTRKDKMTCVSCFKKTGFILHGCWMKLQFVSFSYLLINLLFSLSRSFWLKEVILFS